MISMHIRFDKKQRRHIFNIVFLCFLGYIFYYFVTKIGAYYSPNSDFFIHLAEGHALVSNPLSRVTAPPFYSIVVYLLETLLPIPLAGFKGGALFNTVCLIVSLYYLWLLSKKWLGIYALIPLVWFICNPLTFTVTLQALNQPLSLLLVILALYYHNKSPVISYAFALLAFFARIESIALFGVFFIYDRITYRSIRKPRLLFLSLAIACLWLSAPLLQPSNRDYTTEILHRWEEIPNLEFLTNSFYIAPFSIISKLDVRINSFRLASYKTLFSVLSFLWITIGVLYCYKKRLYPPALLYGYIISYCLIHIIFPDAVLRYSYLILPFIHILFCWPILIAKRSTVAVSQFLSIVSIAILSCIIILYSWTDGRAYANNEVLIDIETRLATEWFNENVQNPAFVYFFQSWVAAYFSTNKNIEYSYNDDIHYASRNMCSHNKDVYIVIDSHVVTDNSYFDTLHCLNFFKRINSSTEAQKSLILLKSMSIQNHWTTIYRLNKSDSPICADESMSLILSQCR